MHAHYLGQPIHEAKSSKGCTQYYLTQISYAIILDILKNALLICMLKVHKLITEVRETKQDRNSRIL